MRATSCSMALASIILGFDIIELWSESPDQPLHCTYIHASEEATALYPLLIVGHYPAHKREHVLSPKLIRKAREAPNRCWWNIIDPSQPSDKVSGQVLHDDVHAPLKTEMCYWLDGRFDDLDIFIVGFSVNPIKFRPSKLKFLNGLGYAIYVAAFDLDEEDAECNESSDHELDNKEFVPRPMTLPFASVASLTQSLSSNELPNLSNISSSPRKSVDNLPTIGVSPSNASFLAGLDKVSMAALSNSSHAVATPTPRQSIENGALRLVEEDNSTVGLSIDATESDGEIIEAERKNSVFLPPTWEPADKFSFPVAEMPVKSWVSDNLSMENFTDLKHLADGSNSHIYLGRFNNVKVIVKIIKIEAQYDSVAVHEFEVEHGILIRVNHPHIIKLLGAGRTPRRFLVLEYLGGGTLNKVLSQNQPTGLAGKLFQRPSFTYALLISKLRDMADALNYLHTKCADQATIIHRDLKPDNIGFTSDGMLKLFDFGLCTCVRRRASDSVKYEMTGNTGSLRYMAPEVALRRPYTEKVDVYSFGIMAWQMARDRIPFKGMNRDDFHRAVVVGGERPPLDKAWPIGFSDLLTSCWHNDPSMRPSFSEIIIELSKLINDLGGKSWPKKGKSVVINAPKNNSSSNTNATSKNPTSAASPPQSTWF